MLLDTLLKVCRSLFDLLTALRTLVRFCVEVRRLLRNSVFSWLALSSLSFFRSLSTDRNRFFHLLCSCACCYITSTCSGLVGCRGPCSGAT